MIIRNQVFETNSSSTHTITIIDRNDVSLYDENNILHPELLIECKKYVDEYIGMWLLTCDTFEKKLSLILHWIKQLQEEENFDIKSIPFFEELLKPNINFDFDYDFSIYDDEYFDAEEFKKSPETFFEDVICNENKIITITNQGW